MKLCSYTAIESARVIALATLLVSPSIVIGQESSKNIESDGEQSGTTSKNVSIDPVSEKKLIDIRHRLIEAAQNAASRVSTSSWLDSRGVLHESTRIKSDAVVRGVQIKSYIKPSREQFNNIDKQCHYDNSGYKRLGSLELAIYPNDGRYGSYNLSDIALKISDNLKRHSSIRSRWVISSTRKYKSAYDQALTASSSDRATYNFNIAVYAAYNGANDQEKVPTFLSYVDNNYKPKPVKLKQFPVTISLTVNERKTGNIVWEDAIDITYPAVRPSITTQELPQQFSEQLKKTVDKWGDNLTNLIGCKPLYFDVVDSNQSSFTINAGSSVGIRAGDHMLIANREKIPSRVLEKGALEQTILVVVESTTINRAELRKIAGPEADLINNVAAMPL